MDEGEKFDKLRVIGMTGDLKTTGRSAVETDAVRTLSSGILRSTPMTDRELSRKIAEKLGIQWGCDGKHHGNGTKECPLELHHHHDERCKLPDFLSPSVFFPAFLSWCANADAAWSKPADEDAFVVVSTGNAYRENFNSDDLESLMNAACRAWLAALEAL